MTTMHTITQDRYGSPDVLEYAEAPIPEFEPNQVLVRVRAASLNPYDLHMMSGRPWMVKAQNGITRPKYPQGVDGAGVVEAVGSEVVAFTPGDEVFGSFSGAFAEYAPARERAIARKPESVSFEQAAATPMAGLTALQGLRDAAGVETGDRVLINGASGGVGTFAVMIAKTLGAHVTAVCGTRNLDMIRSIGADEVIDYTATDYTRSDARFDAIFDTVTSRGVIANRRVMAPDGIWVQAGMKRKRSVAMIGLRMLKRKLMTVGSKKTFRSFLSRGTQKDMLALAEYLGSGTVVPVIDRTYRLAETADALRYLAEGHANGKVIITV